MICLRAVWSAIGKQKCLMDSDLQQRLVEASVARTKLRKDVVQNLFILKQLSHISQLRREGFARASANAYESDTTKQLREDLSDVLSRIESLQEVVVDNKKSKRYISGREEHGASAYVWNKNKPWVSFANSGFAWKLYDSYNKYTNLEHTRLVK